MKTSIVMPGRVVVVLPAVLLYAAGVVAERTVLFVPHPATLIGFRSPALAASTINPIEVGRQGATDVR